MPYLTVDKLQDGRSVQVYYCVYGNPNGIPAVYLHGGPGDAVVHFFEKQYDLSLYRVLLFDQRGCGKSRPRNHLEKNTTQLLLSDIEQLRELLGIERWVVTGGSWGSALGFLYAEQWPERCLGLILRGIYDLTLESPTLESVYPETDDALRALVPFKTDKEFNRKTLKILKGKKTATRRKLIHAMNDNKPLYVYKKPHRDTFKVKETLAMIGTHYETNHFFVPRNAIYKKLKAIQHIPIIMVQGRYDVITPMNIAYRLSKLLPMSELRVVASGHSMHEPEMIKALHKASKDMAALIQKK